MQAQGWGTNYTCKGGSPSRGGISATSYKIMGVYEYIFYYSPSLIRRSMILFGEFRERGERVKSSIYSGREGKD